jgi:branched-chain amino acid transport system ATP-binding protein
LIALAATAFFVRAEEAAFGVALPDIRADFALNVAFLGALASLLSLAPSLLGLPLGHLADRVRRVVLVRGSAFGSAAASVVQGLAGSVPVLAAGRVLAGLAPALALPATYPLMADYYAPARRARVFAWYFAAAQGGLVAGPLLGGAIGAAFGWRTTLAVLGAAAGLVALLTFALPEPVRGAQERRALGAADDRAEREEEPVSFAEGMRAAASISTLRRIWYATPLVAPFGALAFIVLPLYFAEVFQLGVGERGAIAAASAAAGLVALLVAGPIADRLLAERPARLATLGGASLVVQAAFVVLLALAPTVPVAVAVSLALAFLGNLQLPVFLSVVSLIVPPRIRGLGLQTVAPWQILGAVVSFGVVTYASDVGLHRGVLLFVPLVLAGAAVVGSAASGIERDLRAARAAALAGEDERAARAAGRSPLLVCRGIEVAHDGVPVVFGVDLDLDDGEIVALVGTNGAGKSTILRAIAGILPPVVGAIVYDGREITHAPVHERARLGITLVPGGDAVLPELTVDENLRVAARAAGARGADSAARVDRALGAFASLSPRRHLRAGDLSGGEQQMVGLAMALVTMPRLLLVDELSLGLAPAAVEQAIAVLERLRASGTSVLLVEQSLNLVAAVATRAVFLEKGEVRFVGAPAELLDRPDLVRAVLMGRAHTVAASRRADHVVDDATPALAVRDIAVRFGGVDALRGVELDARAGEIVGVIGPNGAGKTTLFDAVSGLVPVARGAVFVDGVDVSGLRPDERARLGVVRSFQSGLLFPSLTVRECVAVAFERRAHRSTVLAVTGAPAVRRSEARIARRVDGLVEILGLAEHADTLVGSLSTGTRRAADLACVVAAEPRVLLLDEPSAGLAAAEAQALAPLLVRLARQTDCTMLLIEHDLPLVLAVATRVIALDLGAVIADGTPAEVMADPRVAAAYMLAAVGR